MRQAAAPLLLAAFIASFGGRCSFGATAALEPIPPGLTSPSGFYRWLDAADQPYGADYRASYRYDDAAVVVEYEDSAPTFKGTLTAAGLKPNFAYQLKLVGTPATGSNERIGLAGRWWEQVWLGTYWSAGWNLNYKGTGISPNPNDYTYFEHRDIPDDTSPTGKRYRHTGYLLLDYFITDELGSATVSFEANSSYHVLWKTSQLFPTVKDGPVKQATFDADAGDPGYDTDHPAQTVGVYGEWERLPVGGVFLQEGDYTAKLILTEESFHGSGGTWAGQWAAAVGCTVQFTITPRQFPAGDVNRDWAVDILDLIYVRNRLGADPTTGDNARADANGDGRINILDLIFVRNRLGMTIK